MHRTPYAFAIVFALVAACASSDPKLSTSSTEGSGAAGAGGSTTSSSQGAGDTSSSSSSAAGGSGAGTGTGLSGGGGSGGAGIPLKLNEDFESSSDGQLPDPAVWEPAITGAGTIEVTTAKAHSGSKSLHVTSPSGSYETFVKTGAPFPVANNTFWGRLYFYLKSTMPKNFVHWTVMEARGQGSNNRVRYGGINNADGNGFYGHWFLFNIETQGMGEIGQDDDTSPQVPAGEWICMEWYYAGQAGQNETRFFWNGDERPKLHVTSQAINGKYEMPAFDKLYIGWAIYQNVDMPYEAWIDDVAIAEERIGCR
jgi:hypothetical protein